MDLSKILTIAGKNGLFKVVSQGKNTVIVESFLDNKRFPAFAHEKMSSLEEISVFTTGEDISLKEVFRAFHEKLQGGPAIDHKSDNNALKKFFSGMVPEFDQERVYVSDIKKMVNWYNTLLPLGLIDFTDKTEESGVTDTYQEGEQQADQAPEPDK